MPSSPNRGTASRYLYGAHVRANGIRQHYLRYGGKGRPVVVVPGITSPAITWGFVAERLAEEYDTYVLDARGRGLSEGGPHLRYSLDDYARDVAEFASVLNLKNFTVVGHSMGGRTAARLGHRHPQDIARIVMADPPFSGPGRRVYGRPLEFYMESINLARQGLLDADRIAATYPTWSEENRRLRAEWLHTCDDTAIAESVKGFKAEEIHSDVAALSMPSLLVVAGKGGVIDADDIAELRRIAPKMAITKVEQCGHMIPFDDLEAFLGSIKDFLRG